MLVRGTIILAEVKLGKQSLPWFIIQDDGKIVGNINYEIKVRQMKWRSTSSIIYDENKRCCFNIKEAIDQRINTM